MKDGSQCHFCADEKNMVVLRQTFKAGFTKNYLCSSQETKKNILVSQNSHIYIYIYIEENLPRDVPSLHLLIRYSVNGAILKLAMVNWAMVKSVTIK